MSKEQTNYGAVPIPPAAQLLACPIIGLVLQYFGGRPPIRPWAELSAYSVIFYGVLIILYGRAQLRKHRRQYSPHSFREIGWAQTVVIGNPKTSEDDQGSRPHRFGGMGRTAPIMIPNDVVLNHNQWNDIVVSVHMRDSWWQKVIGLGLLIFFAGILWASYLLGGLGWIPAFWRSLTGSNA